MQNIFLRKCLLTTFEGSIKIIFVFNLYIDVRTLYSLISVSTSALVSVSVGLHCFYFVEVFWLFRQNEQMLVINLFKRHVKQRQNKPLLPSVIVCLCNTLLSEAPWLTHQKTLLILNWILTKGWLDLYSKLILSGVSALIWF